MLAAQLLQLPPQWCPFLSLVLAVQYQRHDKRVRSTDAHNAKLVSVYDHGFRSRSTERVLGYSRWALVRQEHTRWSPSPRWLDLPRFRLALHRMRHPDQ